MYSSTDFGTLCFILLILCFGMRFFLAIIRLASSFSTATPSTLPSLGGQLGRIVALSEKCRPWPNAIPASSLPATCPQSSLRFADDAALSRRSSPSSLVYVLLFHIFRIFRIW